MGELVAFIAKSLVDHPEQVEVSETYGQQSIIVELRVAPEDMGKVIGTRQNCKSNSHCSQSCSNQRKQKSNCRNYRLTKLKKSEEKLLIFLYLFKAITSRSDTS